MGSSYSVVAKLIFKDKEKEAGFCNSIYSDVMSQNGVSARFDIGEEKMTTPYSCFRVLCKNPYIENDGTMIADFDASYGWYRVMFNIFKKAMEFAYEGSCVYLDDWGEDDGHIILVKNGEVFVKYVGLYTEGNGY